MALLIRIPPLWRLWCQVSGLATIALLVGLAFLKATEGRDAVFLTHGDLYEVTHKVQIGSMISYAVNFTIKGSCPAQVVQTLTALDGPNPAVITISRPAQFTKVGSFNGVDFALVLPGGLAGGRWRYNATRLATCPTRSQTDQVAEFDFEVVP